MKKILITLTTLLMSLTYAQNNVVYLNEEQPITSIDQLCQCDASQIEEATIVVDAPHKNLSTTKVTGNSLEALNIPTKMSHGIRIYFKDIKVNDEVKKEDRFKIMGLTSVVFAVGQSNITPIVSQPTPTNK